MRASDYVSLIVVFAIFGSITYAVIATASELQYTVVYQEVIVKNEKQTLPQKCQPYYNNGTNEWINCMGVGLK
jgi:hypothetical protein